MYNQIRDTFKHNMHSHLSVVKTPPSSYYWGCHDSLLGPRALVQLSPMRQHCFPCYTFPFCVHARMCASACVIWASVNPALLACVGPAMYLQNRQVGSLMVVVDVVRRHAVDWLFGGKTVALWVIFLMSVIELG